MAVPTGPASIGNIQTEFGGSNPVSLSEYYAHGAYVYYPPPTSAQQVGPIPTSGPISIGNFLGVSAIPPDYSPFAVHTVGITRPAEANATVFVQLNTDGTYTIGHSQGGGTNPIVTFSGPFDTYNWYPTTPGIGSSYQILYTISNFSSTANGIVVGQNVTEPANGLYTGSARNVVNNDATSYTTLSSSLVCSVGSYANSGVSGGDGGVCVTTANIRVAIKEISTGSVKLLGLIILSTRADGAPG